MNQYKEYTLTDKDCEKLTKLYNQNIKLKEIISITNIPYRKINKFYSENRMSLVKRYNFNENYFDDIDTETKAYWLGYLYCDGFVGKGKYNNIVLSSIDENVIDDFSMELNFKGVIPKKILPLDEKRLMNSYAKSILYEMRFSNKHMKEVLSDRNLIPNRKQHTFLNIENISEEILIYVLYGMWDADAHVDLKKGIGKKKVISLYVSKELIDIYKEFYNELRIPYSIKYHRQKECFYLKVLFDQIDLSIISKYLSVSKMYRKI